MPMLTWPNFIIRNPRGHLIVASISTDGDGKATALRVRELKTQLGQLLGRLDLDGDYATTTERANGCAEIHAGFEKGADADRLARTVQATATGKYPTWASRRLFVLDDPTSAAIEARLAAQGEVDKR